jgi:serine phosphatase RsbU (regulator of sigma subunit)
MTSQRTTFSETRSPEEALELLGAVLDNTDLGIAVVRLPDLVFELANPTFTAFAMGRDVVGHTVIEAFPDLASDLPWLEAEALGTKEPWQRTDTPFYLPPAPGEPPQTLYATFRVRPLEIGGRSYLLIVSTETTEAVRQREALIAEKRRQQAKAQRLMELEKALDEVNIVIHSSLDYDHIMQRALQAGTEALGASSGAVFVGLNGESEARYVHGFPRALLGRKFNADLFPFSSIMEETRHPVAVGEADMASLMNPTIARLFRVRSIMAIPLIVKDQLAGGIGITYRKPHQFTEEEEWFAAAFGASLGLALENADLFKRQARIADILQSALLTLPERIPRIEFAHQYSSATEEARVGGDFYDLFELEHDLLGITVGDVSGHGVEAAVLTSLVKNAIRVQTTQGRRRPDEILASASQLLYANSPTEIFATVFFGLLNLDDGHLAYCNAGHPAGACICREGGGVRRLPANSPLLGAFEGGRFSANEERLKPGEMLFLYTDGLIEASSDGERFGEGHLFDLLSSMPSTQPGTAVSSVMEQLMAFTHGQLADDLAILAISRA